MTEATSKTLSKYQKAMLTHMGIVPWQLKSESHDEPKDDVKGFSKNLEASHTTRNQTTNNQPSQEQKKTGLDKLRQNLDAKPKSLNRGVLLCMPEKAANSRLVQDLLVFFNVALKDCIIQEDTSPNDYTDYVFAWQLGEQMSLNDRLLTAPFPNDISSIQDKRKLWQIVQQIR